MNPLLAQIIFRNLRQRHGSQKVSRYVFAKEFHALRIGVMANVKGAILLLIGVGCAGFGLKSFLLPNGFIDGGVMGISLLGARLTNIELSLLVFSLNIPFLWLGFRMIGKSFAIKSTLAIFALACVLAFVEYPIITSDKLLVAVFGGFFLGAGIGFAVRGGGVLDGTEILAISLSRKLGTTMGDVVLILNVLIFSIAAWIFDLETAMYSILTYLAASKTVDYVIEGVEEYTGVTIVSSHSDEIRLMIIEKMGRGVTILQGKRGFGKRGDARAQIDVIYTVITRLEIAKIQSETDKIDPNAFMVMHTIKDTRGGMIKKRPLRQ